MDKRCARCKEVKPIDQFYKDRGSKDGHDSVCRICALKKQALFYQSNKEKILGYVKRYAKEHKESISERLKLYYQSHKKEHHEQTKKWRGDNIEKVRVYTRENMREWSKTEIGKNKIKERNLKYREQYPEEFKAHRALNHAVEAGRIPRVKTLICSMCNKRQAEHYHHHNGYKPEHFLDVVPVCAVCHKVVG